MRNNAGFTLIEILIALVIIAIAYTALIKSNILNINITQHLKNKIISHVIAMNGVNMIQIGLIKQPLYQKHTYKTKIFNQTWYWRVIMIPTSIKFVKKITITISHSIHDKFIDPIIAYTSQ